MRGRRSVITWCACMHACVRACMCASVRARVFACARACVRVCVRVCKCACARVCMRVYMRACVRACERACMRTCVRACTDVYMHACECVHSFACVCMCMRAHTHACVRACMRMSVCAHSCAHACMRLRACARTAHQRLPVELERHVCKVRCAAHPAPMHLLKEGSDGYVLYPSFPIPRTLVCVHASQPSSHGLRPAHRPEGECCVRTHNSPQACTLRLHAHAHPPTPPPPPPQQQLQQQQQQALASSATTRKVAPLAPLLRTLGSSSRALSQSVRTNAAEVSAYTTESKVRASVFPRVVLTLRFAARCPCTARARWALQHGDCCPPSTQGTAETLEYRVFFKQGGA